LGQQCSEQILQTMHQPKRQAFWLNTLQEPAPDSAAHELTQLSAQPVPGLANLWSVAPELRDTLVHHGYCETGYWYPMNPASAWAAAQLPVAPGLEVLDLAAAPGGKTLLLAAAMDNRGRIAAVEPVAARFHRMRANLARCGVTLAQFYQADGRGIGRKVGERFDAVLLDAPCSSEARVRLDDPTTLDHWSLRKIRETSRKQKRLLTSAFASLKPGGQLLYSTCAFSFAENEAVVGHLLQRSANAEVLPLPAFGQSAPEWLPGFTQDPTRRRAVPMEPLALTRRILPNDLWDGFYCALLTKTA